MESLHPRRRRLRWCERWVMSSKYRLPSPHSAHYLTDQGGRVCEMKRWWPIFRALPSSYSWVMKCFFQVKPSVAALEKADKATEPVDSKQAELELFGVRVPDPHKKNVIRIWSLLTKCQCTCEIFFKIFNFNFKGETLFPGVDCGASEAGRDGLGALFYCRPFLSNTLVCKFCLISRQSEKRENVVK